MDFQTNKKTVAIFIIAAIVLALGFILLSRIVGQINEEGNVYLTETVIQPIVEEDNVKLPADFPKYPNSELSDSWMRDTDETTGSSFILYTDDAKELAYDFYKRELVTLGWEIQNEDSENYILNIVKDDTQGYLIFSNSIESETLISITFATIKR